jgi:hypothetical protein
MRPRHPKGVKTPGRLAVILYAEPGVKLPMIKNVAPMPWAVRMRDEALEADNGVT